MFLLALGLMIWCTVHLFPALLSVQKTKFILKLGIAAYRGLFSLLIIIASILIVLGWRNTVPIIIYDLPSWTRHLTLILVFIACILFAAAIQETNIKQFIRHPQLTGLIVWSIGHLLVNGDNRSIILFLTLGLWAILEIVFINKRENDWVRPKPVAIKKEGIILASGCVMYTLLFIVHRYFTGVSLF